MALFSSQQLLSLNGAAGINAQAAVNQFAPNFGNGNLAGPSLGLPLTPGPGGLLNNIGKNVSNLFSNPSQLRLQAAQLFPGGKITDMLPGLNVNALTSSTEKDWRVRISITNWSLFANGPTDLQGALIKTNGVIFPYTPSVSVTHNARYQEQGLTHSNYKNYFYEGSDVQAITITGKFTVQNIQEGQYLLAAIYFFRSATKMFFGDEELAGNPPPLVFLDGYGDFYFPHVSCVVTAFSHSLPTDVDYVQIPISSNSNNVIESALRSSQTVRLPTDSELSVTLQPVYSRRNVYNNFTLNKFSRGKLLANNGGFL